MEEEVLIKIKGKQKFIHNGEKDQIVQKVKGKLFLKNDKYYLIYNDNSQGIDGAETKLRIDLAKNRLFLMRSDPAPMKQRFIVGEITDGYYGAGQKKLKISVETEKISLEVDSYSGVIEVNYNLYFGEELTSKNILSINYNLKSQNY